MVTVKRIELPHALEKLPTTTPGRPRAPRVKPEKRTGVFKPRHPALPWEPMPYMNDFLMDLQVRERKPDYIRMVKVGLSHFARFMIETEQVRFPDAIRRDHLVHFQAWVQTEARTPDGNPFGIGYQRKLMCYVRSWIKWLVDAEHIEKDPWQRMKIIRTPKKPKPLLRDEIAALFDAHRRQAMLMPAFAWHRQEVILVLLYGWGLRIHELASLNLAQMDLRQDVVHVKNKGSQKPKSLPYDDVMKQSVQRYLVHRAQEAEPGEEALLVEHTHGGRLSISRIYSIIVGLGERAGVNVNPHRLRDTFGTTMANGGAELEHVRLMFGHSKLDMTMAYVEVADDRVIQTHREVMGTLLDGFMTGTPALPEGIEEPPAGWPRAPERDPQVAALFKEAASMLYDHQKGGHQPARHDDCPICHEEGEQSA